MFFMSKYKKHKNNDKLPDYTIREDYGGGRPH